MKRLVMLGTHPDTMGGISAVVNVYREAGLLRRWSAEYIVTHCDGGTRQKAAVALRGWLRFTALLVTGRVAGVHVHTSSRASFWRKTLFMLPAFARGVPCILHLHGSEFVAFYERECGPLARRLVRYVFDASSAVIVLSASWRDWVRSISRNPNVVVIYNPVVIPPPTPWHARNTTDVLFLGRLGRRKGSYVLLDAIGRLAGAVPDLHALMGGDGEIDETRARSAVLGISDRVRLLGWVRGREKTRLLSSAGVYALVSTHEGLPMGVLEAMAAGLPVLSTPVGGIPEAVSDGVEGFLVRPDDVDALADRLRRLQTEPGLAERMGSAARDKAVRIFSTDSVLPRVEALYTELGLTHTEGDRRAV